VTIARTAVKASKRPSAAIPAESAARVAQKAARTAAGAVDVAAAGRFLHLLREGEEHIEFRTFDDDKAGRPALARKLSGTLASVVGELSALNAAGAGVFAVINRGGQTASEITHVIAVFADTDGADLDAIMRCGLELHFVVESSPGRWHCYWLVDGLPLLEFAGVQRAIAAKFGTDPSVCDLSRVMRLPGFDHRKGNPFRVQLIHESGGLPFTADAIRAKFPAVAVEKVATVPTPAANDGSGLVVVADRHADLLKLAARFAREVRFHGMAETSALATMTAEVARGRYSRAVPPDEIRRAFDGALAKIDSGAWPAPAPMFPTSDSTTGEASSLRVVEVGDLCSAELRPPAYVIAPLIPRGVATLLSGHGGIGKTMLALIQLAHVACNRAWAGFAVEQGRCVFVSLEDDAATVRYTLSLICKVYGLDTSTLRRNLVIVDGSDGDGSLVVEHSASGVRKIVPTANMHALRELVRGATLIVIDNASDAFDADENSRRQVRTFIRALALLARENNAGLILISHVDKQAAKFGAQGNSYSGSTAWHNSVRSREALAEVDGAIELRHEKSNRGRKADPVRLRFDASGVLVPADGAAVECGDDILLLHCMGDAITRGDVIGTARVGAGTALACARTLPGFPAALRAPARFWAAVGRLEAAGALVREEYVNANRKTRQRWAIAPNAPNAPNVVSAQLGASARS